jgi:hypothetical protein
MSLVLVLNNARQRHFAIGRDDRDVRGRPNAASRQSLRDLLSDFGIGDPVGAIPHDVTLFLVEIVFGANAGCSHCFALPAHLQGPHRPSFRSHDVARGPKKTDVTEHPRAFHHVGLLV